MNRASALKRVLGQFFRTTTLHGFKYLWSEYLIDRLGWLLGCVASTCCAGVLCAVLWARFLEVPALLQLQDVPVPERMGLTHYMPQLVLCPPPHTLATVSVQHLNMSASNSSLLLSAIVSVLTRKYTPEDQLKFLDKLLSDLNTTLTDVLLINSYMCEELILKCRWQNMDVPCKSLFKKELSAEGVCCIMRPGRAYKSLNTSARPSALYRQTKTVDLVLQCSNKTIHSCKFLAKYIDETNVQPMVLAPGYTYTAQMKFISIPMSSTEDFVESNCVSDKGYSRELCQDKCAEKYCGFKDPLRLMIGTEDGINLPKCTIKQLSCLRGYDDKDNATCSCLPSCNKITSVISLEPIAMDLDIYTFDPIYHGLHSKSTVLHFQLNLPSSKIYSLNPTETWLTLLSSLGGVFNMFLGVGLFSALEILYLILFKLPLVLFKSQFE